ncbi:MAG: MraY family glycosyltransferase, partial [Pseudomonadota bacterium]
MSAVFATALSMFLVITLVPLLTRLAGPLGLLDQPGPRKIHQHAVPRVGGIAITIGVVVSILIWVPLRAEIQAYVLSASIIFLFGLADDRLGLDYRIKLTGQILGACVFIFAADLQITRLPFFFDGEMPGWAGLPLTLLVIVGVTNAVNMSDGMDGLAGGNSLLAACALGYLIYLGGDKQITLLALSVIGATLGFLRYNTYPARIFMGDAGSQFLGFSV